MNVLEELTEYESQITPAHVEERVNDWERRLRSLYQRVLDWCPAGWSGTIDGAVPLNDEMMQAIGIASRDLPILKLRRGAEEARLEPRGLWIVGANGKVDLIRPASHYLIVDRADNLQAPDWQVASLSDRQRQRPMDKTALAEMLA